MVTLLVLVQSFGVRIPIGLPFNPLRNQRVFGWRIDSCIGKGLFKGDVIP